MQLRAALEASLISQIEFEVVPGEPGTAESESLFFTLTAISVPFKHQEELDAVWTRDCPVVTYRNRFTLPNKILFYVLTVFE